MNSKAISAMIDTGADAMGNMYDVFIKFPGESAYAPMFRAKAFAVPTVGNDGYEVEYHGIAMKRPVSKQNMAREFSLSFRLDASYDLWSKFIKWERYATDGTDGSVANWIKPEHMGEVKVRGLYGAYEGVDDIYESDGTILENSDNPVWVFKNVWVSQVGQPSFDPTNAAPMEYEVQFKCGDVDYPIFSGAGLSGKDTSNK